VTVTGTPYLAIMVSATEPARMGHTCAHRANLSGSASHASSSGTTSTMSTRTGTTAKEKGPPKRAPKD
jgi:hypothetical protein